MGNSFLIIKAYSTAQIFEILSDPYPCTYYPISITILSVLLEIRCFGYR